MDQYQSYILSAEATAIRGSMDWSSLYVDGETCPEAGGGDPYAICKGDAWWGEVVGAFVGAMGGKGG